MKHIDITSTPIEEIISQSIAVLHAGGLVLFPTETTYGAGVDATNQEAVNRLLSYKSRREGKPLSIMVTDEEMAKQYVLINEQAHALYEQFLPGPVTVISKSLDSVDKNGQRIAQGVASEFGTLGVRIPDYDLMLAITQAFGRPITATSANASGQRRPYSVADILVGLSEKQKSLIDLVLDAGELPKNEPSTVIDTTLSTPVVLRTSDRVEHTQVSETKTGDRKVTTLFSRSEQETKEIAGRIVLKHWDDITETGLVIGLDGDLGMGKTIFTKGSAEFLKIEEIIKSPTYTYIEEYDFTRHQTSGKLYHLDMWKVESQAEFERLAIETLLGTNTVLIIEWFSQVAELIAPLLKNVPLVTVRFSQVGEDRKLEIIE
ncbi:MAG: hypothetical protein BroJett025_09690 [Patescibacteria group bacterium]|nr:MAG: hypothetical protein BroJett025_09690 [Patescibacteria group bacterium]